MPEGKSVGSLVTYAALAYVAQTVGNTIAHLTPQNVAKWRQLVREWASTGTGVALATLGRVDILGEVGLDLNLEPLGYILTGLIVGHGVHYTIAFITHRPGKKNAA